MTKNRYRSPRLVIADPETLAKFHPIGFTVTFKAELLPPAQFAENTIKKAFTEIQSLVHIGHDHKREHLQNKKARIFFPTVAKAPKSQEDRTSLLAKLKFERSFASLSFDQIKLERSFASLSFDQIKLERSFASHSFDQIKMERSFASLYFGQIKLERIFASLYFGQVKLERSFAV